MKSSIASYFCAESLAGMQEDSLHLLFEPYAPILDAHGLTLEIPEGRVEQSTFFSRLARIATDIDSGFPPGFYEMLSLAGQLSVQEDLSDILLEARQGLMLADPFQCEGERTRIELAFLLFRWDERFVRSHLVGRVPHPKAFVIFEVNGEVPKYKSPSPSSKATIEGVFRAALKEMNRGDSCVLRIEEMENEVCFVIGHGNLPSMHEFVEEGMPVRRLLRPHEYDMAVFSKITGRLMLYQKRPSLTLMEVYRKTISCYVFGRTDQFLKNTLSLAPLMRLGQESITCGDCATFQRAKLVHLKTMRIGSRKGGTTHKGCDIFGEIEGDPALRQVLFAPQKQTVAAWFDVTVQGLQKHVCVKVALPDKVVVDPPEYLPEALQWLNARGFFGADREGQQHVA